MDPIAQAAAELGSANVVVMTAEDLERVHQILIRLAEEGHLTDEERFAIEMVEAVDYVVTV